MNGCSFKALSRMSSFPTGCLKHNKAVVLEFQSAVAHELISNEEYVAKAGYSILGFKALSRMSSFPTSATTRRKTGPPRVSKRCRA